MKLVNIYLGNCSEIASAFFSGNMDLFFAEVMQHCIWLTMLCAPVYLLIFGVGIFFGIKSKLLSSILKKTAIANVVLALGPLVVPGWIIWQVVVWVFGGRRRNRRGRNGGNRGGQGGGQNNNR